MRAYDSHDRLFRVPERMTALVTLLESDYVRSGTLEHSGWPIYRRR